LQRVSSWLNCMITSGEIPITTSSSAGGAVNRIVEIDCKDQRLFKNPVEVVDQVKRNYGHAGKHFIEMLKNEENLNLVLAKQKEHYKTLCNGQNTEKQAMAASLLLTADFFISKWIFNDDIYMTVGDIEPYLLTKQAVSVNERAYDFLIDYVNIHRVNFDSNADCEHFGEVWGLFGEGEVYIIKTMFDKIMQQEGYNSTAFLSWAKETAKIKVPSSACKKGNKRSTVYKRFSSTTNPINCVCLKLPLFDDNSEDFPQNDGDLEF
jgi:uncharacterized protein (DUF927 family)